ncbi:hypothetical protein GCM10027446_17440 [Angustibacter peucedani]
MSFDDFIEIFNPGHKHLREERDRKRIEAQIPESAGPPFGIDLDAGTARIVRPKAGPDDGSTDDEPAADQPAED